MKKLVVFLAAIILSGVGVLGFANSNTYAACSTDHFMNLPAWYDGLPGETNADGGCSVKNPEDEQQMKQYIWTVALNIASTIFGVAGYLAVLFVIYGGFQYMLSRGDPGLAAKGKKTITNAVIGIVICALASTIAGAINEVVVAARESGTDFFVTIANTAIMWAGIIAVVMIVVGGIYYVSSNGDASKVIKAKNTILYSVIGLVITIVAAAIVNTVLGALN